MALDRLGDEWNRHPKDRAVCAQQQPTIQVGCECHLRVEKILHTVEILGLGKNTIWVSFPSNPTPKPGTGVELELHNTAGFVRYYTRVTQSNSTPGGGVMLERAETATYMKRRREWRVPTDIPAKLRVVDDPTTYPAQVVDLSSEGARIESDAVLAPGEVVGIVLKLPRGRLSHKFTAQIIYHDKKKRGKSRAYGVRFLEVSRRTRRSITIFLWKRIRKEYPDELRSLYPRGGKGRDDD